MTVKAETVKKEVVRKDYEELVVLTMPKDVATVLRCLVGGIYDSYHNETGLIFKSLIDHTDWKKYDKNFETYFEVKNGKIWRKN